jgi:hypothetical protein
LAGLLLKPSCGHPEIHTQNIDLMDHHNYGKYHLDTAYRNSYL